jgi:tetrahedral aminopeptidase
MFIDIGSKNKEETLKKVQLGDQVIFEPNFGCLNGNLYYGKAVDNRVGCYTLLKIMERVPGCAEIYAVATAQEEVGLKGARTSAFGIQPAYAIAVDTTTAGDTPGVKETESSLKLGEGVAITIIEASGRGVIVNHKIKDVFIETAQEQKIKYQLDVIEGGMTDAAMISLNRDGVIAGVLSVPARYVHAPTGVFCADDVEAAIELAVKSIEKLCEM